jgi:hypothetical protein
VEYLKHALCRALGCRSVTDRGLSARQVDALKELVLAPACTPDLVAAVMADNAAVTGRPHRRARDISSMADADSRSDAVVDDSTLSGSFAKCSRHRAPGKSEASQKPAPPPAHLHTGTQPLHHCLPLFCTAATQAAGAGLRGRRGRGLTVSCSCMVRGACANNAAGAHSITNLAGAKTVDGR